MTDRDKARIRIRNSQCARCLYSILDQKNRLPICDYAHIKGKTRTLVAKEMEESISDWEYCKLFEPKGAKRPGLCMTPRALELKRYNDKRAKAVSMFASGATTDDVAHAIGVSKKSAAAYLAHYNRRRKK